MTNDAVHGELILWLRTLLGIVVIKDRQQVDRPALPYGMVDLSNWGDLHEHVEAIRYADAVNDDDEDVVIETQDLEREWAFLFFVYGNQPDVYVNRLKSSVHSAHLQASLLALGLVIHEVGRANSVPELVNEVWEPRTQVNIILRGVSSESFEAPTIETTEFTVTGERA